MNKNRALLLDRDGVINIDHGYVGTIDRFDFIPGVAGFLRAARDRGYRLAILTNQAGVARGYYSEEDYQKLMAHACDALRRDGVEIEVTLACFVHPEGKTPAYARGSFWRKPNPGMVLDAARLMALDLSRCAFLGDSLTDMQAAQSGGVGTPLWLTQDAVSPPQGVTLVGDYAAALKALSA